MMEELTLLIGGEAGQGSRKAGLILGKLLSSIGYRIFIYDDYQSLIRGGHNFSLIRASRKKILSVSPSLDLLLALDRKTIDYHQKELKENGILIYDSSVINVVNEKFSGLGLPLEQWVKEEKGIPLMKNTALIGAVGRVLGIRWEFLEKILKEEFKGETEEKNIKIAKRAFDSSKPLKKIKVFSSQETALLTGNEAISLGMIKAGLDCYFAYPMTPATGILHFLAEKKDLKVFQLESEIAVINAALGASFAGARTAVGTSGGGFALMTEGLSFSAQAEIPLLIIESQRGGPSTGVPTYTSQSDLNFVLGAGHGDFLRFVIAPGDGEEACFWAGEGLNLAWEYQTPVILLVDKQISESTFSVDKEVFKKIKIRPPLLAKSQTNYLRYQDTPQGVSPLAFPGEKDKVIKVTGYEHTEQGIATEDAELIKKMQEKRLRKFNLMKKALEKLPAVNIYGNKESKKALIVWGSVKGVALEVAERQGLKLVQPVILQPFPEKQMKEALKGVEKIIVAENNLLGQLANLLPAFGIKVDKVILKYDGRPFWPEELDEQLRN
ncbi:MAG: 2-oxoacid:acceptor oxidoreductase subunit alpha [Microgenomates group bacterium]